MDCLKVLAARSVASRVTSEESLKKLEVPASLLKDLLLAHRDSWLPERDVINNNQSIPFHSHYETRTKNKMVYLNYGGKRATRTVILPEESTVKLKNTKSIKKKAAYMRHFPQHAGDSAPRIPMSDLSVAKQQVYRLFARQVGSMVRATYPNIPKTQFNQILDRIWTDMPEQERERYEAKACSPSPPRLQKSDPSISKQQVFRIFAMEVGSMVKTMHGPNIPKTKFSQILRRIWTEMPEQEREKYEARAAWPSSSCGAVSE